MSRVIQIFVSVALIAGSLTYLLQSTLQAEIEYFHPADQVMAKADELRGQKIRMGGIVEKGTIFQKKGTTEYQFDVRPNPGELKHAEYALKSVTVRFKGLVPDTFKDETPVVVTGKLGDDGVFHATDLLAKCPSKYEAAEKNQGTY